MRRLAPALIVLALTLPGSAPAAAQPASTERWSGPDRFATAAVVSRELFPNGSETAFVATGTEFPDALAGGPAAASVNAPILLVTRDTLPEATGAELRRLDPNTVVILGGEAAVSAQVEAELADITDVERRAGEDRYATAAEVSAAHFTPGVSVAYVATGVAFPDALAGAAAGVLRGGPVLLVRPDGVPSATVDELERLEPGEIAVLGGEAAVSEAVADELAAYTDGEVRRLAGADRYATAAAVAAETDAADIVFLATGEGFADALAGGPAAALGGPLLLAPHHCIPDPVWSQIDRLAPDRMVVLGGPAAVGPGAEHALRCEDPTTTVITTGLEAPWDVTFTPDGRVFLTERDSGRVLERAADGSVSEVQRFDINPASEGGLLGLTHSPNWEDDGLLYAYMTTADDNRIVRFRPGESAEPVLTGIPRAGIHNGGRIAFGPDGMLYATTGDAGERSLSQRRDTLAGKILRMTPNGQPAPGNPDPGSHIYALGIRNAQGLAWDAQGRLYATEFGPEVDDEINLITANGNYGWPEVSGAAGDPRFVDPVFVRQPPVASWSGAGILRHGAIPAWEDDLFAAALRGGRLWRLTLADDGGVARSEELLVGEFGRLRHVTQAPDGSLWILTSNRDGRGSPTADDDRVIRLGPPAH